MGVKKFGGKKKIGGNKKCPHKWKKMSAQMKIKGISR